MEKVVNSVTEKGKATLRLEHGGVANLGLGNERKVVESIKAWSSMELKQSCGQGAPQVGLMSQRGHNEAGYANAGETTNWIQLLLSE